MKNTLISNFVKQLKSIHQGDNWLEENFKKKIDSLSAKEVFERPHSQILSVAELISHILVWREESTRKLKGLKAELTVESSANWKSIADLKNTGWTNLKNRLYKSHDNIIALIESKHDDFLEIVHEQGYSYKELIEGLIHHDLYHLGQIGITIKFIRSKGH